MEGDGDEKSEEPHYKSCIGFSFPGINQFLLWLVLCDCYITTDRKSFILEYKANGLNENIYITVKELF